MNKALITFLLHVIPCGLVFADLPKIPYPIVTASESGNCYYKQIPGVFDLNPKALLEKAYSVAYKIELDGSEQEMWRTKGWYAFRVFIADSCDYLVRIGDWPSGREPDPNDLAVAFYRNGELLKQYSTADLVKDKSRVRWSATHYQWQKSYSGIVGNYSFQLLTVDDIQYQFDVRTGDIMHTQRN